MSELAYHSGMLRGYHAPPAFQTAAERARHTPHYVEESRCQRKLLDYCRRKVPSSAMYYGTTTNAHALSPYGNTLDYNYTAFCSTCEPVTCLSYAAGALCQ
jgi:hypothetical protein